MYQKKKAILGFLFFGALSITACHQASHEHEAKSADVAYLNMPGMEDRGLPFSSAVRVDNTLYLSGNVGNLPGTLDLAPGGIAGETKQTLDNIKTVLQQFGSSMDNVVKCPGNQPPCAERTRRDRVHRHDLEKKGQSPFYLPKKGSDPFF